VFDRLIAFFEQYNWLKEKDSVPGPPVRPSARGRLWKKGIKEFGKKH
jgi:hypothetical protein